MEEFSIAKAQKYEVHKQDCKRVFKRYDDTCPRCQELINGAPAREGWNNRRIKEERKQLLDIKQHDCKKSNCSVVCTFGDW